MSRARSRRASNSADARPPDAGARRSRPSACRVNPGGSDRRALPTLSFEVVGGRLHQRAALTGSPIGAPSPMPASTSATCRDGAALRCNPPCSSGQPRSPASRVSAPDAAMSAAFSPTHGIGDLPDISQNVPPKPQQTSGDFISLRLRPVTGAEQAARLALHAELAQAGQEIVIGGHAVVVCGDLAMPARRPGTRSTRSCVRRRRSARAFIAGSSSNSPG